MSLDNEKYVLLTTYKRSGEAVAMPVWWVPLDGGQYGFYTSSGSGKVKRLAHTSRVTVQPSDVRGNVKDGTEPIEATAEVVTGAQHEEIVRKIKDKYGVMTKITKFLGTIGGIIKRNRIPYADVGVVVTLAA